jgi:hypothetical protein
VVEQVRAITPAAEQLVDQVAAVVVQVAAVVALVVRQARLAKEMLVVLETVVQQVMVQVAAAEPEL